MLSETTRDRILKESICLFGERGYERVSVRQIASAVGIKESSIYNHYQNKEDILKKIMDYFEERQKVYRPSLDDFRKDLHTHTLEELLKRFFYPYDKSEFGYMLYMNRILFMEQYRDDGFHDLFYDYLFGDQYRYLKRAMDILVEEGLVLPFDSQSAARVWAYSNTVAALLACQDCAMIRRSIEYPDEFVIQDFDQGIVKTCLDMVLRHVPK